MRGVASFVAASLLFCSSVQCAPTVEPSPEGLARIEQRRKEGLARWERERSTDYLKDPIFTADPDRLDVVKYACDGVADEEEKWMCHKRGAVLANRMRMYKSYGRKDSDAIVKGYHNRDNSGVRVYIVKGEIVKAEHIRGFTDQDELYLTMALEKVIEAQRVGTIREDMTFDFIMLFTDEAVCQDPTSTSTLGKALPNSPVFPIVRQSRPNTECPYHMPLPLITVLQGFPPTPTDAEIVPWKDTNPQAVFRGTYFNDERVMLALLTISGMVDKLDAYIVGTPFYGRPPVYQPSNSVVQCNAFVNRPSADPESSAVRIRNALGGDAARVCNPGRRSVWGRAADVRHMQRSRYPLAVDGVGAVLRFPHLLAGSGVVLGLQTRYEEYWFTDLIPYVHYVPITPDFDKMQQNLTDSLAWLEANPVEAEKIAREGRRWVLKHKTMRTDQRQWKLYLNFLNDRWRKDGADGEEPPAPPGKMNIGCKYGQHGQDPAVRRGWIWGRAWNVACAGTDPQSLGNSMEPELRPLSLLQDIRSKRLGGGGSSSSNSDDTGDAAAVEEEAAKRHKKKHRRHGSHPHKRQGGGGDDSGSGSGGGGASEEEGAHKRRHRRKRGQHRHGSGDDGGGGGGAADAAAPRPDVARLSLSSALPWQKKACTYPVLHPDKWREKMGWGVKKEFAPCDAAAEASGPISEFSLSPSAVGSGSSGSDGEEADLPARATLTTDKGEVEFALKLPHVTVSVDGGKAERLGSVDMRYSIKKQEATLKLKGLKGSLESVDGSSDHFHAKVTLARPGASKAHGEGLAALRAMLEAAEVPHSVPRSASVRVKCEDPTTARVVGMPELPDKFFNKMSTTLDAEKRQNGLKALYTSPDYRMLHEDYSIGDDGIVSFLVRYTCTHTHTHTPTTHPCFRAPLCYAFLLFPLPLLLLLPLSLSLSPPLNIPAGASLHPRRVRRTEGFPPEPRRRGAEVQEEDEGGGGGGGWGCPRVGEQEEAEEEAEHHARHVRQQQLPCLGARVSEDHAEAGEPEQREGRSLARVQLQAPARSQLLLARQPDPDVQRAHERRGQSVCRSRAEAGLAQLAVERREDDGLPDLLLARQLPRQVCARLSGVAVGGPPGGGADVSVRHPAVAQGAAVPGAQAHRRLHLRGGRAVLGHVPAEAEVRSRAAHHAARGDGEEPDRA
eukprot:Rhum_TRINITY_DN14668_c14_g1::Rhum_TRINITY_DN14668_c14_g1_i1::g.109338::m.109338